MRDPFLTSTQGFPTSDPLDGHDDEYHHVEKKLLSLVEEIQNKEHKPEGEGIAAGVSVPAMCASKSVDSCYISARSIAYVVPTLQGGT